VEARRFGPVDNGLLPFTLNGQPYALWLPQDGREVMALAARGDWPALLPGMLLRDDQEEFIYRLANRGDRLGLRACWKIVLTLSPHIYGVEWWAAQRVAATCEENWRPFGAWMVSHGFDPAGAAAHRLVSAGLGWMFSTVAEEKEARKLEAQIFSPPRPVSKRNMKAVPGFSPAEQAAAFQSALNQLGSTG